jgi:hypothetical protein
LPPPCFGRRCTWESQPSVKPAAELQAAPEALREAPQERRVRLEAPERRSARAAKPEQPDKPALPDREQPDKPAPARTLAQAPSPELTWMLKAKFERMPAPRPT